MEFADMAYFLGHQVIGTDEDSLHKPVKLYRPYFRSWYLLCR